jgi:pyrroline-5-carboxylate reductase
VGIAHRKYGGQKVTMKLGFIGTGRITSALVVGLCTAKDPPENVLVSPRNAAKAAKLAARFSKVSDAESNQALIDGCDCAILAIVPQIARSVLTGLRFRSDQTVISLVPTISVEELKKLVDPVHSVARAVPLPSVTQHLGPIPMYPEIPQVVELFDKLGDPIPVQNEKELNVLWTVTALIAPFYALMEETSQWAIAYGVNRQNAESQIASMFHAISAIPTESSEAGFSDLATEAATPGGFNEQALSVIREQGGYKAFLNALDAVHARHGKSASGH